MMTIRPISAGDQLILRDLRLRALKDSPTAFGSNYTRESAFTDADWAARITKAATPGLGVMFFACDSDTYCGLIGCFKDDEIPSRAWIVSMWVAPESRRRGVGAMLMEAAEKWARNSGFAEISLDVTEDNTAAMELYKRCGFNFTGETSINPNDPNLREFAMVKPLAKTDPPEFAQKPD
jgi:ribosomal protein S18 acetylase RimI-like enzyme